MTYAIAEALQEGIYTALIDDDDLAMLVGNHIYDATPSAPLPSLYVSLGPETVQARNDGTGEGALHRFTISVVSDAAGFRTAKATAVAVSDVLHGASPLLTRGRIVALNFERATAKRVNTDQTRQIDLRFKARVENS